MVIATQNLVESHGTFPLPNSQLDRFLISMKIGLPTPQQEMEILTRSEHGLPQVTPVLRAEEVVEMQEMVKQVPVALPVKQYIVKLVEATRNHVEIVVGVSPRGAVSLVLAAQGWAAFANRDYVVPEDIKEVGPMVLGHRITLVGGSGAKATDIVTEVLDSVQVPL